MYYPSDRKKEVENASAEVSTAKHKPTYVRPELNILPAEETKTGMGANGEDANFTFLSS